MQIGLGRGSCRFLLLQRLLPSARSLWKRAAYIERPPASAPYADQEGGHQNERTRFDAQGL